MKERGIIFKGWGVRAIRNMKPGVWPAEAIDPALPIKWQTRRTRNLDEINTDPGRWTLLSFKGGVARFRHSGWAGMDDDFIEIKCPYGIPGDVLWVRETWAADDFLKGNTNHILYRADYGPDELLGQWKPSIHMFRWASRDDLVVKEVRVERVQEISEEDAKAEGVSRAMWYRPGGSKDEMQDRHADGKEGLLREWQTCYRNGFATVWGEINYARGLGWEANPWAWVVSYMRKARS